MKHSLILLITLLFIPAPSGADDWLHWRGPEQNGVSRETGLPDVFSFGEDNKNVAWVSDIGGRATPIVLNGRVYLNCRTNDDFNDPDQLVNCREQVICWDAKSGDILWKDKFNVFQTDIPAPRVGWAAMCGDKETGNVYLHSVSGIFRCYDPDGKVIWEHSLLEEFGKISGYGGRTQSPIIDEDRVIVSFLAANWGETKGPAPKHFYYAFDKRNGELQWVSAPGGAPKDTNYSVPMVTVIDGQRMLIGGNADGGIYAINARTGKKIWGFGMSKRGLNSSPVVEDNRVYISHGEDNIDTTAFGRIQCINATGKGNITKTHSVWRKDGIKAGYTGLLVNDGILYVVADTGNMFAFDSKTGEELWVHNLGTVGKGSPVWADGKIYVMEVNGNIHILKPSREGCEQLCKVTLKGTAGDGAADEIYSSPAISDGRVFLVTRDRTICLMAKDKEHNSNSPKKMAEETAATANIDSIQLRPYEVVLKEGESAEYEVHAFDANGRFIKKMPAELKASEGFTALNVSGNSIKAVATKNDQAGVVTTSLGEKMASARVRVMQAGDVWSWNFDGLKGFAVPPTWIRAHIKMKPFEVDGNVAMKMAPGKERPSHMAWLGTADMTNYTIQSDVMMREQRRQLPSVGITASRYNFIAKGNTGKLSLQSWAPHLRMAKEIKFRSDPDLWYTMKLKVVQDGDTARVMGKIWERDKVEPEDWTIETVDPHANKNGSPGIYVYALSECFFDNVKVSPNK